jgi:hypothetical protein
MKSIIPLVLSTITILCFQNCAPGDLLPTDGPANFTTDETFVPYIQEFEKHYQGSTANIPIGFADLASTYAGVCYRSGGHAYIKIDKAYWPKMSEYQKLNLIFHELGHCALNRGHTEVSGVLECPTSFMHPQVMSTGCIARYLEDYIKELF